MKPSFSLTVSGTSAKVYYGIVASLVVLCIVLNSIFSTMFLVYPGNPFIGIWAAILLVWMLLMRFNSNMYGRCVEYMMVIYGCVSTLLYLVGRTWGGVWFIMWTLLLIKHQWTTKEIQGTKKRIAVVGCWYFWITIAFIVGTLITIQSGFSASIAGYNADPKDMYTLTRDGNSFKVFMNCIGNTNEKPTLILQSGAGAPGMSLMGIQLKLNELGYKACIIDRPGYGLSDPALYLPHDYKNTLQDQLDLMKVAQINEDKIVIGHSAGGQLGIQLCGADSNFKGAILLDSVQSNYIKEIDSKVPDTYWYNADDAKIKEENNRITGALQLYRFMWCWGIISYFTVAGPNFKPEDQKDRYNAYYRQDKVWESQYLDWQGTLIDFNLENSLTNKNFPIHTLRAVANCTNTAKSLNTKECEQANKAYLVNKEAAERQINMTGKGSVEFCKQPCDHGFPSEQIDMTMEFIKRKIAAILTQ